jgi:hypothetical protein
MPKSPKSKPVKRASKPKMMMTGKQADALTDRMHNVANIISLHASDAHVGSKDAIWAAKRMISCADALYKAAGAR